MYRKEILCFKHNGNNVSFTAKNSLHRVGKRVVCRKASSSCRQYHRQNMKTKQKNHTHTSNKQKIISVIRDSRQAVQFRYVIKITRAKTRNGIFSSRSQQLSTIYCSIYSTHTFSSTTVIVFRYRKKERERDGWGVKSEGDIADMLLTVIKTGNRTLKKFGTVICGHDSESHCYPYYSSTWNILFILILYFTSKIPKNIEHVKE